MDTVRRTRSRGTALVRDDQGRKECGRCREWKPENEFSGDRQKPDGFNVRCRDCVREARGGEGRIRARGSSLIRDEQGRKECSTCCEWKPESEFSRNTKAPDGLFAQCRPCKRDAQLAWAHGLAPKEVERRLQEQGYKCKICKADITGNRFFVDHDHTCCRGVQRPDGSYYTKACGKCARGLLCRDCNTGLSSFRDSVEALRAAADYVEQFRQKEYRP